MAVAAGNDHTLIVGEDGSLFACGYNDFGQLGTGDTASRFAPTRVVRLPAPVRQVATSLLHTGIVTDAGDLLMCGRGMFGRLGLGDENKRTTPTLVPRAVFDGEAVLMVACGMSHTAAVTEGGGVYTFGLGDYGQLGHGDWGNQLVPRRVPATGFRPNGSAEGPGERIAMVAVGGRHTVGLSEAGHVFTWGRGWHGQLGHGGQQNHWAPRQVEAERFGGEKVVFVATGGDHTVAVTAGGRLYTWGDGDNGRLGHGDTFNRLVPTLVGEGAFGRVVMAACGDDHTLVVTEDGALWACGRGLYGELGLNDRRNRLRFERVGAGAFGMARVVTAAADRKHSVALTDDGALWTWGSGDLGQLGHGDVENRFVPMQVTTAPFDTMRVGQFHLTEEHIRAFYMSQHRRLGANSVASNLKPELLDMIVRMSTPKLSNDAISRLLGFTQRAVRVCKYCS